MLHQVNSILAINDFKSDWFYLMSENHPRKKEQIEAEFLDVVDVKSQVVLDFVVQHCAEIVIANL